MGWINSHVYLLPQVIVVINGICCLSLRKDTGQRSLIQFHPACNQPIVTKCPSKHDSSSKDIATKSEPGTRPELVISEIDGTTVGNMSWLHIDLPDVLFDYGVLRLSLSVRETQTVETCLDVIQNVKLNSLVNICILLVADNSVRLTMEVVVPYNKYCTCDGEDMSPSTEEVEDTCRWKCSTTYPVWSMNKVHIGQMACLKYEETGEVTMDLMIWEITPNLLMFEFTAFINNPFALVNVYVHKLDEHNPIPLLEFLDVPHYNGSIFFKEVHKFSGQMTFYAKLCMQCTDDDWSYPCYITEDVTIQNKLEITTFSAGRYELQREEDTISSRQPVAVVIGATVTVIIIMIFATLLVYLRRKSNQISRGHDTALKNNVMVESKPLYSYGDADKKGWFIEKNTCLCESLKETRPEKSELNRRNMLLYHPDSPSHQTSVEQFVQHLSNQGIKIDGLLSESVVQNWRDFAEMAGDIYTNIVIIYSKGLYDLFNTYHLKGTCDKSKEIWERLLQQRHEEYIPCVALLKLKCLSQGGDDSYNVYFVLMHKSDRTELENMISKHVSFLKTTVVKVFDFENTDMNIDNLCKNTNSHLLSETIEKSWFI